MPFRSQKLSNERLLESGVGPRRPAPLPHLVGVQGPEIQGDSLAAIPISGTSEAAIEVSGSGTSALPIGGSATAVVEVQATASGAIPISGTATGTAPGPSAVSSAAIPISGSATGTAPGPNATSTRAIPIGGSATATNPAPLIATLSDGFVGANGVGGFGAKWQLTVGNGSIVHQNNMARISVTGVGGGPDSATINAALWYDWRNAVIQFYADAANLIANVPLLMELWAGANTGSAASVLGIRWVKTGAGTGTVAFENNVHGTIVSAAFNPDTTTQWKIETTNTTYGVTDRARLYKSDGAGGWTLVLDTNSFGALTANLIAVKVAFTAYQLIAGVGTWYANIDEFNTVVAAGSAAIPIGGTPTGTVEVKAGSNRAIPIGGSATGTTAGEISAVTTRAIPIAGAASGVIEVQAASSRAIPISGSATGTAPGPSAASSAPIPISGSAAGTVANVGGAHSRWRILVTANAGIFAPSFAEVEFRATIGGADQANGGTPSASSTFGGFPATLGFDNNNGTLWSSATNSVPQWLAYQFTGNVSVGEVFLKSRSDVNNEGPAAFSVQYSDDGITWITLWSVSGQTWTGTGIGRAYAAPSAGISAVSTRAIPIGGSATATVQEPTPPWTRTDLGPDVAGGGVAPVTTAIGIGPVTGLPRNNFVNTVLPPAEVFDGVYLQWNRVTVNPANFAGLIVNESVQRDTGTGFPSAQPFVLTFDTPIRGFKVTARSVDFDTGKMVAKDENGTVLATVFFPIIPFGGIQSVTREIQLASNLIRSIELTPDPGDWIAWNAMEMTVDHLTGAVGGWERTDLDEGAGDWELVGAGPATAWSL